MIDKTEIEFAYLNEVTEDDFIPPTLHQIAWVIDRIYQNSFIHCNGPGELLKSLRLEDSDENALLLMFVGIDKVYKPIYPASSRDIHESPKIERR